MERPVGTTGTDGTQAGGVRLRLNFTVFFPSENQEQMAPTLRSRASMVNTVTISRDRVVC